ncbi:hypothetical protein ABW20_dc0106414 [Dactylellina cionopaga]|nr:hypothetical protein ABW20_dc0106414 [Dactylellina cionopaga]
MMQIEPKRFVNQQSENLRSKAKGSTSRKRKAHSIVSSAAVPKRSAKKAKTAKTQEPEAEDDTEVESDADDQDEEQLAEESGEEEEEEMTGPTKARANERAKPKSQPRPTPVKQKATGKKYKAKAQTKKGAKRKEHAANGDEEEQEQVNEEKEPPKLAKKRVKFAAEDIGDGKIKKRVKVATPTAKSNEEGYGVPKTPALPEYDHEIVDKDQAGVKYNSYSSAEIPNVTIPLGGKFRIEPSIIELTENGEYTCDCMAFKASARTIKTCKHLFLLNGYRFEKKRQNDGRSEAIAIGKPAKQVLEAKSALENSIGQGIIAQGSQDLKTILRSESSQNAIDGGEVSKQQPLGFIEGDLDSCGKPFE